MSFSTAVPDVNPLADVHISFTADAVFRLKSMNWTMLLASPSAARASAIARSGIRSRIGPCWSLTSRSSIGGVLRMIVRVETAGQQRLERSAFEAGQADALPAT